MSHEEDLYKVRDQINPIKWDLRFLRLAKEVASWSKDPSTKVGAVIVDDQRRVISLGYNGFARGVEDSEERLNDRTQKYPLTVHAEVNAIVTARADLRGMTIYCWPLNPCAPCASIIRQAGITRVVSVSDNSTWKNGEADKVFSETNIELVIYDHKDLDAEVS